MFNYIVQTFKQSYVAIIIGIIGGYLATLIHLPLPWLLGSLGLNLIFAFTKINITFPQKLLNPIFLIIGIILGGTFNVTLLYKIHLWIFSSIAMIITTVISTIIVSTYFYKVCKFKKIIAVLAGLPGAFVPIVSTIFHITADKDSLSKVVIPQATRVILIVCFLPFFFVKQIGYAEINSFGFESVFNIKYFAEIIFLILVCIAISLLFKKIKIPSSILIGSMAASGIFYTFEIIDSRFPDIFINLAFVLLGTALGSRLNGLKLKELLFFGFHGSIITIILIGIAMFASYLLSKFFGFDFMSAFLSFAPGGIHEMVVISVAYNIDPIFVSYHHFLRIFIIVLLLPIILKKFGEKL